MISADTIVVIDNKIIGKPTDAEDAKRILRLLSDKVHYVYTGYAIHYQDKSYVDVVESKVIFNKLNEQLIDRYVKSGSPLDKAGAYGVQDNKIFPIVKEVQGSMSNVIGFPYEDIKKKIEEVLD